jgi:protein-disulfide isomerase
MAGLETEKAKACMNDAATMDALLAQRTEATEKYNITATPTFIVNNGEDKIMGAVSAAEFSATVDKILAKKK